VVASEQLEKAQKFEIMLEIMGECLAPSGAMIVTTPCGSWDAGDIPYNRKEGELPATVRVFTQDSLQALLGSHQDYYINECHFLPYSQATRQGQGWIVGEVIKGRRLLGPKIRVFCGDAVEAFTPLHLMMGGIGGSETAVIQMADAWNRLGASVAIYRGDRATPNSVGIFDGVLYQLAEHWSPEFPSDLFVSWRLPHIFAKGRPNADKVVLWCHDIHFPIEVKAEWMEHVDLIAVLTEWHKEHIMSVHPFPEEKMWVTRNGIDPGRYNQKITKKRHNYFFSSSHERGLKELLALWPKLRESIPDAVLHVAYGTYTHSQVLRMRGDHEGLDKIRAIELQLSEMDGIKYYGRLNQWELSQVQMECEAWLYPYQHGAEWNGTGGFPETYCITALEAMAAKCVPVSRDNAGLGETLKNYIPWAAEDTDKTIIAKIKKLPLSQEKIDENYKWAMRQTWQSLAREWMMKLIVVPQPVKIPVEV
jgi:glycosyltransferase involved in cell wall biosynthesis